MDYPKNRQQQYSARHPAPDSGGHQFDKSFRCKYILAAITPRGTRRSARLRITTADLEKDEPRKKGPELKSENRYQFVTKLNSLAASAKVPKRWEKGFLFFPLGPYHPKCGKVPRGCDGRWTGERSFENTLLLTIPSQSSSHRRRRRVRKWVVVYFRSLTVVVAQ